MPNRQKRCAAAARCTNFDSVPDRHRKRYRCGIGVQGAAYGVTANGKMVCCEDCEVVHAEEGRVRTGVSPSGVDEKADRLRADGKVLPGGARSSVRC